MVVGGPLGREGGVGGNGLVYGTHSSDECCLNRIRPFNDGRIGTDSHYREVVFSSKAI